MSASEAVTRLNAALSGRYTLLREIGEGGMATVYLADDVRHNRKVALKVLKPELAAVVGSERFLAEIKTTANLQHPHILPLFDSGEADSFLFYVMPYVEGESLRGRLDREHQLPVDEAVQIAKDVAGALDYAHRQGVIHRDIKPANILLQDGKPVVSDFGIALALGAAGAGNRLTETGLSLGTPHYMSPEQATGDLSVGAATDTYALGCVLYEMLVGEPPFTGSTPQAVLGKIVTGEAPSASAQRKSVLPNVDATIRKTLEKLPADRFASAGELSTALSDPGFRHGKKTAEVGSRGLWNPLSIAMTGLAAVLALLALGLGWSLLGRAPPASPIVSAQVISAAPAAPLVVTDADANDVAISPDGRTIVYQTASSPGELSLRPLDQLESRTLELPSGARTPFFSYDGRWVAYQAGVGGPLQRVSIEGGPPQTITDPGANVSGASWGPDDMVVFSLQAPEGLYQVRAAGGEVTALTESDSAAAHQFPDVLPNGAGVLFTVLPQVYSGTNDDYQIAVFDVRANDWQVIVSQGTHAQYVAGGYVVYALGSTLMGVRFDPERLEVTGDPVPVIEGVLAKPGGISDFKLSETGSLTYVRGSLPPPSPRLAVWVDQEGSEETLPLPPGVYEGPRLSPDGTRLAIVRTEDDGNAALWVYPVAGPPGLRLTQEGRAREPVWLSNDRLAFTTAVEGSSSQIHTVMADGSSPPELLLDSRNPMDSPTSVTPDGNALIFRRFFTPSHSEIFEVPLQGDPAPVPLVQGDFNYFRADVSPDGQWLLYTSNETGVREVYARPYRRPGGPVPVSVGGVGAGMWSADGTEIFYQAGDRIMGVSFDAGGGTPSVGSPRELGSGPYFRGVAAFRQYDVAADGRFLMLKPVADTVGSGELAPQVILVQNFTEELRQRVPN